MPQVGLAHQAASAASAARVILLIRAVFGALLAYILVDRFVAYRRAERLAASPLPRGLLQRRLRTLAAIKVTGPMLGLLGTLLGLINAFAGMAMTGAVDPRALGAGVAEALVLTALGLVIGLPAWWAHSFFAAWAERIAARAEASSRS